VSKPLKLNRQPVVLGKSRIRRDPVPLEKPKLRAYSPEFELWSGITGILLFAAAIAIVTVGIGVATFSKDDPVAAAKAARFGQCYNTDGPNCVFDGDTFRVGGETVQVAGIDVPKIQDARCAKERNSGIDAAVRLADLLNSGKLTIGPTFADELGRDVRKVLVNGQDVREAMLDSGVARRVAEKPESWCSPAREPAAD
jgi:micrococcal nuclease